jgi:hypothetical protein
MRPDALIWQRKAEVSLGPGTLVSLLLVRGCGSGLNGPVERLKAESAVDEGRDLNGLSNSQTQDRPDIEATGSGEREGD